MDGDLNIEDKLQTGHSANEAATVGVILGFGDGLNGVAVAGIEAVRTVWQTHAFTAEDGGPTGQKRV
jgi:hypothetical protein